MAPLYPLVLQIQTPHGVFDAGFEDRGVPPTVLRATPVRANTNRTALNGAALVSFAAQGQGTQLSLSIPDDYAQPLAQARALQLCQPGDIVRITENLTRRDTLRVWENVVVMEPDSGAWVVGNEYDGEYFSLVMAFLVV